MRLDIEAAAGAGPLPAPGGFELPPFLEPWTFAEGGVRLDLLSVPDVDLLIDDDLDLDRPPYWAVTWPSARALARQLVRSGERGRPLFPPGTPVLELGCGAGLVGLVAARLGARVVQTDYIAPALTLAGVNAERNALPSLRRVAADWRHWPLRATFPLVLASDVTYEGDFHAALADVLDRSLAPGGVALLADPGRLPSLSFFAALERDGWKVTVSELPEEIFLYRVTR